MKTSGTGSSRAPSTAQAKTSMNVPARGDNADEWMTFIKQNFPEALTFLYLPDEPGQVGVCLHSQTRRQPSLQSGTGKSPAGIRNQTLRERARRFDRHLGYRTAWLRHRARSGGAFTRSQVLDL